MAQNLREFLLRLKVLFNKRRLDRDLADELAFHQAMLKDKLLRQGVAAADADVQTRRAFGSASRWQSGCVNCGSSAGSRILGGT
jgi:hypothetical protein